MYHEPVLLKEILENLRVWDGSWYIDATLGDGGHSLEILKQGGNIVGIDVDPDALKRASDRFRANGVDDKRFRLIQGNFRNLNELIKQTDISSIEFKGVVFDLGVSSLQLENPERGFSFQKDGPLDMRMDPTLSVTATDLLKVLKKGEINELFSNLGEEKHAWALVAALERAGEIKTTGELARLAERVVGRKKSGVIHPATRVFQALRIAVNNELDALKEGLRQALDVISENGRILVISFHSLEDRIVKNTFKDWEDNQLGKVITRKPIVPTEEEIMRNPRSRSAKLRIFEK